MPEQHGLDLGAVNILAAAQYHVLDAIHNVEESVGIEIADVAGVQPAVHDCLGGGFGAVDVTLDDLRALQLYFSRLASGKRLAAGVHATHVEYGQHRADTRRSVAEKIADDAGGQAADLGHAEGGYGFRGSAGFNFLYQIGLHGRAAAAEGE